MHTHITFPASLKVNLRDYNITEVGRDFRRNEFMKPDDTFKAILLVYFLKLNRKATGITGSVVLDAIEDQLHFKIGNACGHVRHYAKISSYKTSTSISSPHKDSCYTPIELVAPLYAESGKYKGADSQKCLLRISPESGSTTGVKAGAAH